MANSFMNNKLLAGLWLVLALVFAGLPGAAAAQEQRAPSSGACQPPLQLPVRHTITGGSGWDWVAAIHMLASEQQRSVAPQCMIFSRVWNRDPSFCCRFPGRCPGWMPPGDFSLFLDDQDIGKYQLLDEPSDTELYLQLGFGHPLLLWMQDVSQANDPVRGRPFYAVASGMVYREVAGQNGQVQCVPQLIVNNPYARGPQLLPLDAMQPNIRGILAPPLPRTRPDPR